ncbi:MAG: WD40 repeat domain-containing protein [Flexilinea sp.]|nr:WD40 repeat domain-containing protein [Flexilinea sp.]
MKFLRIMPILIICLLTVTGVFAQTQEAELIVSLDLTQPVNRMVWNESGDVLMLASKDAAAYITVSSPDSSNTFELNGKSYSFTSLSETGVIAALSPDWQTIYIYEPGSEEKAARTIEPGFQMLSVSVSKDGSQVLADSAEQIRTVVYDAKDGTAVHDLTGFETAAPVYDSTLSVDGTKVVWHSRGTLAVQNVMDGTFGKTVSLWDFISDYELSPDNSRLAVGIINDDYEAGAVIFFDPVNGKELGRTLLGKTSPNEISFCNDGSVLWASDVNSVYRIDPETFELSAQIPVCEKEEDRIMAIASSPDGSSAAVLVNNGDLYIVE